MSFNFQRRKTLALIASATLVAGLGLTACSSDTPEPVVTPVEQPEPAPDPEPEPEPEPEPLYGESSVAHAHDMAEITIYNEPAGEDTDPGEVEVDRVLKASEYLTSAGHTPMTFLIEEEVGDWAKVHLPVRPNGTMGWIHSDDYDVQYTSYAIEVEMEAHHLKLYEDGEVVFETDVGVGMSDRPTPGGVYYIKELLRPPNPEGVYGVYAYGLSGYSEVLTEFNGGPGDLGLHGTNNPDGIGTDVSNGCVRMRNDEITQLVEEFGLPLGTPVHVLG